MLAKTDHPFVVSMYWSFQSKTKLYFIMEYCAGGELFHFLKQQTNGRVAEKHAKFYATEVPPPITAGHHPHTMLSRAF